VLAERFARVFILPSRRGSDPVLLPANVVVVDPPWPDDWPRGAKLRAVASRDGATVLAQTFARPSNWLSYARGSRWFLDLLAMGILRAGLIEAWASEQGLERPIFYDYWFETSTLAIALLRKRGAIGCAVSRAHRFDVFDSAWPQLGRVPFREFKARHLDAVFPISEDGASYMRPRFGRDAWKIHVHRLAVPLATAPDQAPSGTPVVVSCSALLPRKEVHRIPDV